MRTVTPSFKRGRGGTMTNGRQYAVSVDGTMVTYECSKGHRYRVNYGSKRLPVSRRVSESGCRWLASWHSRSKGGCSGECPECMLELHVFERKP